MNADITADSLLHKTGDLGRLVERQVLMLTEQSALIERLMAKVVASWAASVKHLSKPTPLTSSNMH